MKWLMRLIVCLYPASWRHRYGTEFDALLEDITPGWRDFLDVLKGALEMHMTIGILGKRVAVFGVAGALLAAAFSLTMRDKYLSEALLTVQNAEGHAAATASYRGELEQLVRRALNRDSLIGIIEKRHLYERERVDTPMDTVIDKMRSNISIRLKGPTALEVSFVYPDAVRAQNATSDLLGKLIDENIPSISTILRIDAPAEHAANAYLAQPHRRNWARTWRGSFDGRRGCLVPACEDSGSSLTIHLGGVSSRIISQWPSSIAAVKTLSVAPTE